MLTSLLARDSTLLLLTTESEWIRTTFLPFHRSGTTAHMPALLALNCTTSHPADYQFIEPTWYDKRVRNRAPSCLLSVQKRARVSGEDGHRTIVCACVVVVARFGPRDQMACAQNKQREIGEDKPVPAPAICSTNHASHAHKTCARTCVEAAHFAIFPVLPKRVRPSVHSWSSRSPK